MKFIATFFVTALLLLMVVAFINYYFDPSGIFDESKSIEKEMASSLQNNKNIFISNNFDDRFFQLSRIEKEEKAYSAIITGSSRVMPIRSQTVGTDIINLGVSGACLDDHVVLGVMATEKFSPKSVILGVDPWLFNKNLVNINKSGLKGGYEYAFAKIGSFVSSKINSINNSEKYFQLINFGYTKESIKKIIKLNGAGGAAFAETEFNIPVSGKTIIRSDGSREQYMRPELLEQSAIDNAAIAYSKIPVYNLQYFEYSEESFQIFLNLLDYLSKQSKVVLILPPYHPVAYPKIIQNYPAVFAIESKLRDEASKRGIQVLGSYDPEKIQCLNSDFIDGMHPTERCWGKIFKETL